MKLIEQLTLVTLQTAHHGSTSPRIASTQRNHASRPVSTDFCNKICQKRSFDHIVRTAQEAYSGNPAFRRPSINSFEFLGTRAICADIVKAGSISSTRAAAACASASRPRWAKADASPRQAGIKEGF